jgi:DNA helicase-2/ATP-dependent DNA helicase PcrA
VAAAVRRQYRWFVVDEFQDVSPIQTALLDLWLDGRGEVCVVGDPAQTIYSFAGASARPLLDFPKGHQGTTTITLDRNYRSTPEILTAANAMMRVRRSAAVELRATREAGPEATFVGHPDEVAEAEAVVAQICQRMEAGAAAADIGVLFRINAQSEVYEEALAEAGVPYVVRGADRFFDRPEVRQALTLLRGAAKSGEHAGAAVTEAVTAVFSSMGWSSTPPDGRGSTRDQWESLQAIVGLAEELSLDPSLDLPGLVRALQARAEAQHAPTADGVTLTTLHAAKGLEWPHVFLVGVHEGTMPITYARDEEAIEEERRLLYVGMTRARDTLAVSWAAARTPGGRGSRGPSRFLDPLVRQPGSTTGGAGSTRGRRSAKRGMQACRVCGRALIDPKERKLGRCLDCPSSYDEALFEELRQWRRERAAEEDVPAYCVFTDATLTALAEVRPSDTGELVRVPGVGKVKIDKYGADILRLCGTNRPAERLL